jgi:hypothetical protein
MEGNTAPPTIQRIAGRDLPPLAVGIPWLALPVPIPYSAAFLSARVPTCRILFLLDLPRLGVAFRAESVHS